MEKEAEAADGKPGAEKVNGQATAGASDIADDLQKTKIDGQGDEAAATDAA